MRIRPEDLFRDEKERAQTSRNSQHARLLAEAKAAFDKLMALPGNYYDYHVPAGKELRLVNNTVATFISARTAP